MFLANENFPRPSTIILRENGFSVKSIQEDSPGISDQEVIKIALNSNLIILTLLSNAEVTFAGAFTVIVVNNVRQRFYKK